MRKESLSSLCKIINGYAFKSTDYTGTGYRVIRITNVQKGIVVDNDPKFIPEVIADKADSSKLMKNDILISLTGNVGRVGRIDEQLLPAVLNQRVGLIRINTSKLDDKYLFQYLNSDTFENEAINNSNGVAQLNLSSKWVEKHQIPLPPLVDQKRIAHLLGKVEGMIARRKQHLQQLDELLKSVFLEMFGSLSKPKFNTIDLNNVCIKITDGTHQSPNFLDSGVPFLLVSNITNNEIDFNAKKFISEEEFKTLNERTPIELGDILYTSVGSYGNPALVKNETKFAFQRHIAYLKPDKSKINEVYLYGVLASDFGKAQADKAARGVAQKTVNLCDIKKFILPNPPITLQKQFAAIVEKVESLKSRYQSSLSNLENLYGVFSQKAFKGELDLSRVPMEEETR